MFTRWMRIVFPLALVAFAALSAVRDIDAHHAVLRFNLEEMTATADRVFVGHCISVNETEDEIAQGVLPVTRYTFRLERAVKGKLPREITITQLGHPARRAVGKGGEMTMHGNVVTPGSFLHGMSEYRVGDRVVLFLIRNYLEGKATYPVGLYQGAFYISKMPSGQELVRNGINNLGLFTAPYNGTRMKASDARVVFPERNEPLAEVPGLSISSETLVQKRGALPLEPFLQVVERIVATHGDEPGVIVDQSKGKGAILQ
jgi:hypothetical protein